MKRTPLIDIYRDRSGCYRWRLRAVNGRIIADSAEGYDDKRGVMRAVMTLRKAVPEAVCRDCAGIFSQDGAADAPRRARS
jgi:uncharacterized protein YegP (UPF0339 family)